MLPLAPVLAGPEQDDILAALEGRALLTHPWICTLGLYGGAHADINEEADQRPDVKHEDVDAGAHYHGLLVFVLWMLSSGNLGAGHAAAPVKALVPQDMCEMLLLPACLPLYLSVSYIHIYIYRYMSMYMYIYICFYIYP